MSNEQKLGSDDAYMGPGGPPMAQKRAEDVSLYRNGSTRQNKERDARALLGEAAAPEGPK